MKRLPKTDQLFQAPIYCAVALGIASSLTLSAAAADFTDANWISLNPSIPGADNPVNAAVVDNSGNLYIGGFFRVAGGVTANRISKWNGSSWSALGSGLNGTVSALAVSGSDWYVAGGFVSAGGTAANGIA